MTFIQIIHIYAIFPARFAFLHKKEQMKKSSVLDKNYMLLYFLAKLRILDRSSDEISEQRVRSVWS